MIIPLAFASDATMVAIAIIFAGWLIANSLNRLRKELPHEIERVRLHMKPAEYYDRVVDSGAW